MAKMSSIRALYHAQQTTVIAGYKDAFLYGDLEEDVYMEISLIFSSPSIKEKCIF